MNIKCSKQDIQHKCTSWMDDFSTAHIFKIWEGAEWQTSFNAKMSLQSFGRMQNYSTTKKMGMSQSTYPQESPENDWIEMSLEQNKWTFIPQSTFK